MATEQLPLLDSLKGLALLQQEFIRIALYVASQGTATFEGETLACTLGDKQRRVSSMLAMAAGQSMATISRMAGVRGIPVRDAYPIARSAVESFVNASFLLAESDEVAERAIRYISFAHRRQTNRTFGSGNFSITVRSEKDCQKTLVNEYPDFSGKDKSSWTQLDVPSRIRRVGECAGKGPGSRLLAAYGLVYSISSEIIHGSPYGVSFFFSPKVMGETEDVEGFRDATGRHLEEILIAVLHAGSGYLASFFAVQEMRAPLAAEERLFVRLVELSTMSASSFPSSTPHEPFTT